MVDKPVAVITGANGFIGSHLVAHFSSTGWRVHALVHAQPVNPIPNVQYSRWELLQPIGPGILDDAGSLIHCASVKYEDPAVASRINVQGTLQLLDAVRRHGVGRTVFLSSMSARPGAISQYGQDKFQLQQLFDRPTELAIRPGLVLGNGGLFDGIRQFVQRRRFVPLVGGGHQLVQTVFVDDLAAAVAAGISRGLAGTVTVAEREPIEFRELLAETARQMGSGVRFIPVPYWPVAWALAISRRLGIALPVSRENLVGLRALEPADVEGDLERLGIDVRDYRASLRAILEAAV